LIYGQGLAVRVPLVFPLVLAATAGASALLLAPRLRSALGPSANRAPATDETAGDATSAPAPPAAATVTSAPSAGAEPPSPPPWVHENPEGATACPAGMVLVDGIYCPYVGHRCTKYLYEERDVCAVYAPEVICEGRLEHRRYCMDRYEYPNLEGVYPVVMVDFDEAKHACSVEGKRLCTTDEWELACEGPQMWPYPYGATRDPSICNIDKPHPEPELVLFSRPWAISAEVDRLDQRVRSGEMPRCVSPFGVHDMTGNVDEWAYNAKGKLDEKPYQSGLKGGYWGPIRARCRPMTSSHNRWFSFYQVGLRCCADARPSAAGEARAAPPASGFGVAGALARPRVRPLELPPR
jgi:hypothetical protein